MNLDQPSRTFGLRGREIRASATVAGGAAKPALAKGHILWLAGLAVLFATVPGALFWTISGIEKLNAETARAEHRVIEIVNQPITHLRRSGYVALYSPGWFHPGAIEPDFDNVDIRTTQELWYKGHVSSDLNPSEMFIGSELEFNKMTKYFYVDRTLPKKRLSDAEMVEINSLYRVIGRDKPAIFMQWLLTIAVVVFGLCLGYALLLLAPRNRQLRAG